MTGIQRFIKFLEEIAKDDMWEYEDGSPMQQDARDFLNWINEMEYDNLEENYGTE